MLELLVKEIRNGGTLETGVLAAKLGASPQLVQAMLEHLQRSGLIKPYANCGEGPVVNPGCQGCGLQEACGSHTGIRLWQSQSED